MTKELTPLEALEKIGKLETTVGLRVVPTKTIVKDFAEYNIIETALKEYELMKQTKIIVADKDISDEDLEKLKNQRMLVGNLGQCEIKPLFDEENQKKLKALEIIKDEFEIYFDDKKQEIDIQSVEYPYPHIRFSLTREIKDKCKYDLLKEVLL